MKFLYLKGVEVLGPVEAKQLVQESWYSDDVLVCPENMAEQETAWKSAKDYPEFTVSLEQEIFPAQENKEDVKPAAPAKPEPIAPAPAPVAPVAPQPPVRPAAPVVPEKKEPVQQNQSQDLPALEDTKTEPSTDLKKKENQDIHEIVKETVPPVAPIASLSAEPQDHTFRIPQEGDDNILEDLPSQSIFESNEPEDSQKSVVTPAEKPSAPVLAPEPKQEMPDHSVPLNEPLPLEAADNSMIQEHSFLEISNNKIISSSDGRVKKAKKNDLMFILIILSIAVIAVAVCFALLNMNNGDSTEKQNTEPAAVEQVNIPEPIEDNTVSNNAVESQPTPTVEDQTIDIVKNTMLKNKGKTIEEYFKSIFNDTYQTSWSSKPFTDKVYIVEFFASQVRSEPYVYLFRVDTEQQKITGALNNITLDLLG